MTRRRVAAHERLLRDRGVYDIEGFEAWLAGRHWAWQGLDRGDYGLSFDDALILFTVEDPVRWGETFMRETNGDPYRLFGYQRASARSFGQDVVHEDGAEVGKTREMVLLLLWGHCTSFGGRIVNPSSLVAAPQQIFLNEIIDAIERQIGVFKAMPGDSAIKGVWLEPRRTPHTQLRFACPNPKHPDRPAMATIDFRPAGHDGEAFRGVHVTALGIVEEAAKMQTRLQWSEFYRALMPGCKIRAYSVPDGNRNTEFYRICQAAVLDLPPGAKGFRKFYWPKTIMPPPFWSAERDAHFARLYGGRESPGYQRNVLGLWGDAENPVFTWNTILPNVVDMPDYRVLKISVDGTAGHLRMDASKRELALVDNRKAPRIIDLGDVVRDLEAFQHGGDAERRAAFQELLAPFVAHIDPRGVFWAGADLGERNDPTEIVVSEDVGDVLRDVLRVQARGLGYHMQQELLFQVDRAFGHRANWGVDLGSAGTAVVKNLYNLDAYAEARFEERLVGFHFQEAVDCIGEDGEPLEVERPNGDREILRAPAKHWATQCVVARLQRTGYRLAYDEEVLSHYTSHTARQGAKWPIYRGVDDHDIDARRLQMLVRLRMQGDMGAVDVFASTTHQRQAA